MGRRWHGAARSGGKQRRRGEARYGDGQICGCGGRISAAGGQSRKRGGDGRAHARGGRGGSGGEGSSRADLWQGYGSTRVVPVVAGPGTARTSLIVTIGPSSRHYSETSSTIMFGQRAMKVVNTIKLKEEVDFEILYKKMEREVDHLTSEMERQQKLRQSEKILWDKKLEESEMSFHDLKKTSNMQIENLEKEKCQLEFAVKKLVHDLEEEKDQKTLLSQQITYLEKLLNEKKQQQHLEKLSKTEILADTAKQHEKEMGELLRKLEEESLKHPENSDDEEKLHMMLKQDGGIKALLGMFRTGHSDVIAQIARGIANFAKCESRLISQGHRKGKSLLIEDGVLAWMVANSNRFTASTRRHIELAFCHLAQNEDNTCDIIASGGIKELLRISRESPRDDTRNLAKKALDSNPAFLREIQ
ncbi:hypothetical protein PR202_ga27024 [Eleusine coracana subsp. coracana]|uniref:Kinesin motor domain-containing protein n=1 Tax=Eleusine coracana subsp. coracana TaxID=191504 RepID=A0AAV5DFS7_ELECO|nr:hypothetical protein PR202_ga27024 [Eleusine coracana subsp. coracana]